MDYLQPYLMLSSVLFSLGIYAVITRKNAVAIGVTGFTNTEPTGLSTYPTVSRRNVGLRTTGSIQPS